MKNLIKIVILASLMSTAHAESYETFMTRRSQQAAAIHMRSSAAYAGNESEPSGAGINERKKLMNTCKWKEADGAMIRTPSTQINHAMLMLHGANIGNTSGGPGDHAEHIEKTGQEFIEYADESGLLLVLPASGVFVIDGILQQNWDWTGHFHYGGESQKIIETIKRLSNDVGKVWLHGGSAGGVMAWKVGIELERMAQSDLIHGLICTESISPFSTSATNNPPPAFKWLDSRKEHTLAGFDFYDCAEVTAKLGLPNSDTNFAKQMLYQYSVDDPIVPTPWKIDFATALEERATALTVKASGSGHNLGPQGWSDLVAWMKLKY